MCFRNMSLSTKMHIWGKDDENGIKKSVYLLRDYR